MYTARLNSGVISTVQLVQFNPIFELYSWLIPGKITHLHVFRTPFVA